MRRRALSLAVGIAAATIWFTYFTFIDTSLKAASELRWDKRYAESVRRLEQVLPYIWIDQYRSQAMLKLGFNYRDLGEYDKLLEVGGLLHKDYPGTVAGYYGLKFQGDYLLAHGQYTEAEPTYQRVIEEVVPRRQDDVLHVVREDTLFELAGLYFKVGHTFNLDQTVARLRAEYPQSPYVRIAEREFSTHR